MKLRNIAGILILLLSACRPEMPVTSSVIIDLERHVVPVNKDLYGVTLEEINHAVEGGIYAEMIRNRSFEDGAIPVGCSYDPARNCLITPAGWDVPFVRPDEIPGWRPLSPHTWLQMDTRAPLNEENRRSLFVRVALSGKGGVVAEGFRGIALAHGEQYNLSFYIRGDYGKSVSVTLRDTMANARLSDVYRVSVSDDWRLFRHMFTATDSTRCATLVFEVDSGVSFSLDMVSLFPVKTWKNRHNGIRPDLAEAIAALNPKFVRFPGGAFAESYVSGATPDWDVTTGPLEYRKPLWSIWGYGTTNGFGFHEYLQLCEDLKAFPIYVMSVGVLNQRYRTRYGDMQNLSFWTNRARKALAYACSPTDSLFGRMRAANGHADPFALSHIALGDNNSGEEYVRRYRMLKQAVKDTFPYVTVIATDESALNGFHDDWLDTHYMTGADNLIALSDCLQEEETKIRRPMTFIGAFGAACSREAGSMRAAVGEAAFLTGVERCQSQIKGVSYAPLLGHAGFRGHGTAAILFDASRVVMTPSYHVLQMFAAHRGDEVLDTQVKTYRKPLVSCGRASFVTYGDAFDVGEVTMDGIKQPLYGGEDERSEAASSRSAVSTRGRAGRLPVSEMSSSRMRMFGDSTAYNYTFSVRLRRIQAGGSIRLNVRDNGLSEEGRDCISLVIKDSIATLFHCAGSMRKPLGVHSGLSLVKDEWATVKIECKDDMIRCYMNGVLWMEAAVASRPSIVAVATRDMEKKTVILKVVNTALHEERVSLHFEGGRVSGQAEVIRLSGASESRNTFKHPQAVIPVTKKVRFSGNRSMEYLFPANSVTILTFGIK